MGNTAKYAPDTNPTGFSPPSPLYALILLSFSVLVIVIKTIMDLFYDDKDF